MSINWYMGTGIGMSRSSLVAFDKALINAGVGNYNLVRLSSILPAKAIRHDAQTLRRNVTEGFLLPTAYSTITSNIAGETIVSAIGVGIPKGDHVGVIMEYSDKNICKEDALKRLDDMICEAIHFRDWEILEIVHDCICTEVTVDGVNFTTFACISEW